MSILNRIFETYPDDDFVIIDECNNAIIGVDCNQEPFRLVYSAGLIIQCFVDQGMDPDDAIDHFEYNVQRSIPYVENAPLIIYTDF